MIAQSDVQHLPLASESIDLIFCDPPYPTGYLICYEWLAQEAYRVLKVGGFVLAMAGGANLPTVFSHFENSSLKYFYEFQHKSNGHAPVVWRHANGKKMPILAKTKSILAYSKGPSLPRAGNVQTLVEFPKDNGKDYHEWGQDVASARYYIDYFSKPDDLVLDPFVGGGTTLIACELIGRRCVGLDIDMNALTTTKNRRIEMFVELPAWSA